MKLRVTADNAFQKGADTRRLWHKIASEITQKTGKDTTIDNANNKWKTLKKGWRKAYELNEAAGSNENTCVYYDAFEKLYANKQYSMRKTLDYAYANVSKTMLTKKDTSLPQPDKDEDTKTEMIRICHRDMTERWEAQLGRSKKVRELKQSMHKERMEMLSQLLDVFRDSK